MASELSWIGGGAISLVSALAVMFFNHRFEMRRLALEVKQHPSHVVYDKQIEFFEAVAPLLLDMNSYVITIDICLRDSSADAPSRVQQAVENNSCVQHFVELFHHYDMYLPEKILREAMVLHTECLLLYLGPDAAKTHECTTRLLALQNTIRESVGADALSKDLFQALSTSARKDKSAEPGHENPKS